MVQTWRGENWFENLEFSLWITLNPLKWENNMLTLYMVDNIPAGDLATRGPGSSVRMLLF